MSTQHTNGERVQLVPFTNTEAHGIICAAMFIDYNTIHNGRDNEVLVAALNGDFDVALRLAVIKLANYKIHTQCHDVTDVVDNLDNISDDAESDQVPITDDTFGGPRSLDTMYNDEDSYDGSDNY